MMAGTKALVKRIFLGTIFSLAFTGICHAELIDSLSIAGGWGKPDNLRGGRIAAQKDWDVEWLPFSGWYLTGYWDASFARWSTDGDIYGNYKNLNVIGFNPVFRYQFGQAWIWGMAPWLEASVGLSLLSNNHLGHRDLGSYWQFQDLLGLGFQFGSDLQYGLGYYYLHYSNARICPPNQGIDVKGLVMFTYRFGGPGLV